MICRKAEFLSLGIASLLVFVQQNWTGPNASISDLPLLNYEDESVLKNQRLGVCEELVMDGENIVSVVQFPELLLISRLIIKKCYDNFRLNVSKLSVCMSLHCCNLIMTFHFQISPYWHLRAMFVHQQVLEESSQKLFDELNNVMNEIRSSLADCKNVDLTELYLEFARIHLYYNHVQKSKCDVEKALECSRIQTSLIGTV